MKIRTDFVTNSSSSSYICDFCGADASGWDLSLNDAQMYECVNGHTFCESHVSVSDDYREIATKIIGDTIKSYDEYFKEVNSDRIDDIKSQIEEMKESLENVKTASKDEIIDLIESCDGEFRYEFPAEFCPLCKMEKLIASDGLAFLKRKYNLSEEDILAEMKSEFSDYRSFKESIKGV